ncbi:hypothetical protein R1flu_009572 [Riccia fluitans]|uniref:Uncharacterized protein n=1 Tax=Riccia fluitans TaxID=41844 RepID=A0ABD1Z2H4_9MARC
MVDIGQDIVLILGSVGVLPCPKNILLHHLEREWGDGPNEMGDIHLKAGNLPSDKIIVVSLLIFETPCTAESPSALPVFCPSRGQADFR